MRRRGGVLRGAISRAFYTRTLTYRYKLRSRGNTAGNLHTDTPLMQSIFFIMIDRFTLNIVFVLITLVNGLSCYHLWDRRRRAVHLFETGDKPHRNASTSTSLDDIFSNRENAPLDIR